MTKKILLARLRRGALWLLGSLTLGVVLVIGLLRFVDPPTSAFMVRDHWQNPDREILHQWVDFEQISPWMPLAVIASEEQRFMTHRGVDTDAMAEAIARYRQGYGLRGASTITQQTAKNLFLWSGRHFTRKALEAGLALGLEALWPKRRIMEVYLNVTEFGEGIFGVEMASRHFFNRSARELTATQAARLAAVLPSPKRFSVRHPSDYLWQRVDWIRNQMVQLGGRAHIRPLIESR
ncbi:monofunctional biosynthetic peptidoglycan transglycosylase [Marinobacter sp. X15-166B]|uniref:monofunctional biosynthetic peptidoglycan transglycosylase n=1 Tax=Marinobacter sp. X15-166B TaxID=1897620 RepID=UPI00085C2740|nr:monofunctional biosynthetic peptidoglycan transglycosylase [Marinobacter sp. X15-166B]OEY65332.1 monofunctional biosynthetic peptidoglycan transglycosylase [Marinobacter sp. X15-166B]